MAWVGRKATIPLAAESPAGGENLQQRTMEIGGRLLAGARKHRKGLFSAGFWSDQLVSWTMKDPAFRMQLFRFIDVFPMLRTPEQVHDYLIDYLGQPGVTLPTGHGSGAEGRRPGQGARGQDDRRRHHGHGAAISSPAPTPRPPCPCCADLWTQGVAFSVDLLGEACVSERRPRPTSAATSICWRSCPRKSRRWPAEPRLENDHLGPVPRTSISIKISALSPRTDAIDFEGSLRTLAAALRADPPQSGRARGDWSTSTWSRRPSRT